MRSTTTLPLLLALAGATPAMAADAAASGDSLTILGLYLGGLMFLLFEAFLVPGFGLPGLVGCALMAGNAYLVLQGHSGSAAWSIFAIQGVVGVGLTVVAMKVLPHTVVGKMMTHEATLSGKAPVEPTLDADLWVGKEGKTAGSMRPQGRVRFGDDELPARSRSGLINAGQAVRVVAVEGRTLVVVPTESA